MKPSEMKKLFHSYLDTKTSIDVSYHAVEKIIDTVFKNVNHKEGYHLPCSEERGSSDKAESWEIDIKPEPLDADTLDTLKAGKWPMYSTREILCEICRRGLIPSGNYLIDISW